MSLAEEAIRDLDSFLAEVGQDIVLRRVVGQGGTKTNVDVDVRAAVASNRLEEKEGAGASTRPILNIVISPTQIKKKQWMGFARPTVDDPNPTYPRKFDQLRIDNVWRDIDWPVDSRSVGNTVVRFDIRVTG